MTNRNAQRSQRSQEQKRILRYYRQRFCGGRSALARAADFLALRLILLCACYLWFSSILTNKVLIWLLSATAMFFLCVALELLRSIRMERFVNRERKKLREQAFYSALYLLPQEKYLALIRAYVKEHQKEFTGGRLIYTVHRASAVSADDVLAACRAAKRRGATAVTVFCTPEVSDGARKLAAEQREIALRFLSTAAILSPEQKEALMPDDDAVDQLILFRCAEAEQKRKAAIQPFGAGRVRRYLLVAAGLFAASFFVKYALYYRLLAAGCVSFASLAWWLSLRDTAAGQSQSQS